MSVQAIIDRIIADAREQAEEIIKAARAEAQVIRDEGRKEAAAYYERKKTALQERFVKEKERNVLNRRLQERKGVLQVRQDWMDRAFSEAYRKLVDQSFSEYEDTMISLIRAASGGDVGGDAEIMFGAKGTDRELQGLVKKLNEKTKRSFTMAEERGEFPWGAVLRKGKIETNISIDSLFRYGRNDLEQKAWELFNADD